MTDLKNKVKDCEFALTDDLIKDCIVCGVNSDTVKARLLRETDLNLAKAVDICHVNEVTESHMKVLHEEAEVGVNKIMKTKSTDIQANFKHTGKEKEECTRCVYVHEPRTCQAYFVMCARERTILAICAKHQNKKANREKWRKKSMR